MLSVKKILNWCINILWFGCTVLTSCRFILKKMGFTVEEIFASANTEGLALSQEGNPQTHSGTLLWRLSSTIYNWSACWSAARLPPGGHLTVPLHRHVECQHSRPIGGSHSWYYQFSRPVFLAEGGGGGWKAIISSVSQSWGRAFPITLGKETRQSLVLPTHLLHFKSVAMSWNALKSTGVKNCGLALFALENLGERWEKCMSEFYDFSLWSNIWYTADQCHLAVCMSQRTWAKYKGFLTHIEWP